MSRFDDFLRWHEMLGKPSLRVALVLCVLLPLIAVLIGFSYVGMQVIERQAKHQMEEDVQLVARAIQLPLGRALERERTGTIDEALKSAFSINRVYGAYVYDADGELISSVGQYNQRPNQGRLSTLADGSQQGEYEEIQGRSVYSYFVPLTTTSGRVNGLLHVTRRASDIQEYLSLLRWLTGGALVFASLLIAGLVLYGHHWSIGTHLNRLSDTMARVEEGDMSQRAMLQGPQEIASLAEALNTMLESIEQARAEVEERRRAQLKLEKQLQHAEKLAAIGQLSAGVAHELGTPLSVIDGKAQRALRRDDLSQEFVALLTSVRTEVDRMERIVRQLLDFGRRNTADARVVSARRLAQMAISGVQEASAQQDVWISVESSADDILLRVDPALIERALVNLLNNAIEASPGGRVQLSWFAASGGAGFVVNDDGPGIDAEIQSRIFEPFFTTKDIGKGTGLGLAVVHGIVEEHGGRVTAGASPWGGAQVRIEFPPDVLQADHKILANDG